MREPLSRRVSNRLIKYTASATAMAGAAAAAQGAIVPNGGMPSVVPVGPQSGVLEIDVDGDGTVEFELEGNTTGFFFAVDLQGFAPGLQVIATDSDAWASISALGGGFSITANAGTVATFDLMLTNRTAMTSEGQWQDNQRHFVGFSFPNPDAAMPGEPGRFAGWLDVQVNAGGTYTLHGYAYEDNGGAIDAGAIPTPAAAPMGLAALAAGAAGLRRRRAAARAA